MLSKRNNSHVLKVVASLSFGQAIQSLIKVEAHFVCIFVFSQRISPVNVLMYILLVETIYWIYYTTESFLFRVCIIKAKWNWLHKTYFQLINFCTLNLALSLWYFTASAQLAVLQRLFIKKEKINKIFMLSPPLKTHRYP